MNAYLTCDRIEERRWINQQIQDEKDKWIDDRAQELISMFPDKPLLMSSLFLPKEAQLALTGEKAEEAYNDYISAIAYARAEEEWERKFSPLSFLIFRTKKCSISLNLLSSRSAFSARH